MSAPEAGTRTATAEQEAAGVALLLALQRVLAPGRAKRKKKAGGEAEGAGDGAQGMQGLQAALERAHRLCGTAAIRIDPDDEELHWNDLPIAARRHGRVVGAVLNKLRSRGIAELKFARPLTSVELTKFLGLIQRSSAGLEPVAACRKIVEGLWETGLRGTVDIISLEQYGHAQRTIKVDPGVHLRLVYARLLSLVSDSSASKDNKELRRHFLWRLSRAVQALVAVSATRERELLAFVRLERADTFVVKHAVNTCLLSVLLGQRLGLPKDLLCQVGLAGLLCWSGKLRTPAAIVNKAAAARTPEEAREYGRHPYRALASVLELRRLEEPLLLSALVAVQFDARPGCPPRRGKPGPAHPLAQIVGLCEAYEVALGAKGGQPPKAALDGLLAARGRAFDPTLVQLFAGLVANIPG